MKPDPRMLRSAFGTFMTGVTVVTARDTDGAPVGFTANSYTSVSLDPPLLLVCPARSLSSFPTFAYCERFAVNVLADDQQDVSHVFATLRGDRFDQVRWHADAGGTPLISGAVASFSCRAHQRVEAGDHIVLIGLIESFEVNGGNGLGYANGSYFSLAMERRAEALARDPRASWVGGVIEHQGHVLLSRNGAGWQPPRVTASGRTGSLAALRAHLEHHGLSVTLGPVYSIYDDSAGNETLTWYRASAADSNTGGLGEYLPVDTLDDLPWATSAVADMMRRYRLERQQGMFGLYVGDEREGDVHTFAEATAR
jgi:flavin-dependent trigonelline monooxygenase, reductase component